MALSILLKLNPDKVEKVIRNTSTFFVVAIGRSGTVFLANLLDEISSCAVFHEYSRDRQAMVKAYSDPNAYSYLLGKRRRLIAARIIRSQCSVYGEVNSYLRYHVQGLRQIYGASVFHLVRNGRDVVRSIMNRDSFRESDRKHTGQLGPKIGDQYFEEWSTMDRFSRVCWYWAKTNEDLLKHVLPIIRLEDITRSYEAVQAQITGPLGLQLDYDVWKRQCNHRRNASSDSGFPGWTDWSADQKLTFDTICGPVMGKLGYIEAECGEDLTADLSVNSKRS